MTAKIMVTGCAGFIGFHVTKRLLEQGNAVMGVDNLNDYYDVFLKQSRLSELTGFKNFSFHKADISDRGLMQQIWDDAPGIDRVIHLAAQAGVRYSLENPFSYIYSNIVGHLVILELCRHRPNFRHLIYASSSSVYGNSKELPLSLSAPTDSPLSLYAATKKSDEMMTHSYSYLYGLKSTGLRFFTVYGPWGRPDMSAYIFTKGIMTGVPIPVFNGGEMRRDFTFIDDIVAGILGVLEQPLPHFQNSVPHKVYNLGNHKSEPLLRFIEVIEKAVGKKAILSLMPMQPGDVQETYADIEEAMKDFGFSPKTSIDEGIPAFVKWYHQYLDKT